MVHKITGLKMQKTNSMSLRKINLLIGGFLTNLLWIQPALAQDGIFKQILGGFQKSGDAAGYSVTGTGAPTREFVPAWVTYINGFLTLFGLLFLILVIYGGWVWMTARGNQEKVSQGKKILIQAAIGFAFILAGRVIFELVILALSATVATS